jgi:hypothetical protein
MNALLLLIVSMALTLTDARPAQAFAACNNNYGFAPRTGATLPPRAKLVAFADFERSRGNEYVATIDGKPVNLKVTKKKIAPYFLTELEVDSDKPGRLDIYAGIDTRAKPMATYTVKAGLAMPKEIAGTTGRFTRDIQHTTVKELFDALAIDVGDVPAILAHVKIRRDDKAPWSEFDLPIHAGSWLDKSKSMVLIGALGCTSNYTVGLLENGVDLQVTAMLPDGKLVPVKLPARVTLPKPPKQP